MSIPKERKLHSTFVEALEHRRLLSVSAPQSIVGDTIVFTTTAGAEFVGNTTYTMQIGSGGTGILNVTWATPMPPSQTAGTYVYMAGGGISAVFDIADTDATFGFNLTGELDFQTATTGGYTFVGTSNLAGAAVPHYFQYGTFTITSSPNPSPTPTPTPIPTPTPTGTYLTPGIAASTLPASVVGGTKVRDTATVDLKNNTAAIVNGAAGIRLYLSSDGTLDSSSTLLATLRHNVKLKVGNAVALKVPVKSFPSSLSDGDYTLLASVTDAVGTSPGIAGPSIKVAAPFVSPSASGLTLTPLSIVPGKSAALSVSIADNGNVATTGVASINFGLSSDGQTESSTLVTLSHKLIIKPTGHAPLRLRFKVPKTQAAGTFFSFFSITQDGVSTSEVGPQVRIT